MVFTSHWIFSADPLHPIAYQTMMFFRAKKPQVNEMRASFWMFLGTEGLELSALRVFSGQSVQICWIEFDYINRIKAN